MAPVKIYKMAHKHLYFYKYDITGHHSVIGSRPGLLQINITLLYGVPS